MSWKDKLQNIMYGQTPENEYNQDYEGEAEEPYDEQGYAQQPGYDYASQQQPAAQQAPRPTNNFNMSSGSSIEMKVVKPEKLESVTQIADQLLARKTILLNLEETNKETSRRLIDFLNGVAYAISGTLKKVANNTYVITPSNVEVSGEQLHEAQEKPADVL